VNTLFNTITDIIIKYKIGGIFYHSNLTVGVAKHRQLIS